MEQLLESVGAVLGLDVWDRAAAQGVNPESLPLRSLSMDSLAMLECGIHLEEHCGVSINPSGFDFTADATAADLLRFINGSK